MSSDQISENYFSIITAIVFDDFWDYFDNFCWSGTTFSSERALFFSQPIRTLEKYSESQNYKQCASQDKPIVLTFVVDYCAAKYYRDRLRITKINQFYSKKPSLNFWNYSIASEQIWNINSWKCFKMEDIYLDAKARSVAP